jgi:hypothetical protein
MSNIAQTTEEPKLNIENNGEILSSVYGAIISQKSQQDYLNTYPIKVSKQNIIQYILSIINYVVLMLFVPYKPLLNSVILSKAYWIALTITSAYLLYYIVLTFPIKNKLYVSSAIKAWIMMFAVLIYFMVIRN